MNNPVLKFSPFLGLLLGTLYFSQGLPSGFLAHALPVLMREHQVPLEYIGFLKLLALPWFFKFMWAPAVDKYSIGKLGAHRGWILLLQTAVIAVLFSLSLFTHDYLFGDGIVVFLLLLFLLNTLAATQDIATDGLAVRLLPEKLRGLGNSLQVGGYKFGMIISGNFFLIAFAAFGWSCTFQMLAVLLLLATVPALLFRETELAHKPVSTNKPTYCKESYWKESYTAFMARPGLGLWLAVLLTYKIADSLGSAMIKPLLVDSGYSLTQIAQISLTGMCAGLLAAFIAGGIYYRLGWRASLLLFGFIQALGIGTYAFIAMGAVSPLQVYGIAVFEQMADGMSTVTLFALMMSYCREGHEGSDFTLQVSMHMMIAGLFGMFSGFLAKYLGYDMHFMITAGLGMLALLPVLLLVKQGLIKQTGSTV